MFRNISILFFAILFLSCGGGGGDSSDSSDEPTDSDTGSSTGVNVEVGDGELIVSWSASASRVSAGKEGCSYNVYIASESGLTADNYEDLADGAKYENATSPFAIDGLDNNKTYYVLVTEQCGEDEDDIGSSGPNSPSADGSDDNGSDDSDGSDGDTAEDDEVVTFGATVDLTIPDPNLKKCITKAAKNAEDIVELGCRGDGISNLTGIDQLKNVKRLYLDDNKISDLGPLKNLTKLEELYLRQNSVTDLTPLAGLASLIILYLDYNRINDITPLQNIKTLQYLLISYNLLENVCLLGDLPNLRQLHLKGNSIVYVETLGSLSKATEIDLRENVAPDLSPSLHCDSLKTLINALGSPPVYPDYYDQNSCTWYFGNASSPCEMVGLL